MKEIEEAYCSYEVAKLLKERGFDEECYQKYDGDGYLSFNDVGYINAEKPSEDFGALAPTHQMACAWIRNKYDIDIWVEYCIPDDAYVYTILIKDITDGFTIIHSEDNYSTYEEATEAALMHVLTNLI